MGDYRRLDCSKLSSRRTSVPPELGFNYSVRRPQLRLRLRARWAMEANVVCNAECTLASTRSSLLSCTRDCMTQRAYQDTIY